VNSDCLSQRCESGLCKSCSNKIKDSDEGDVDCGGEIFFFFYYL
jgi:hypothetical protein